MSPTITEIAEAFSRHEFDRTFPHMDVDIEWTLIGVAAITSYAEEIDGLQPTEVTS